MGSDFFSSWSLHTSYFFEFSYVNDLGQSLRNDLYLEYSHTFMNSIISMHLPAVRSQHVFRVHISGYSFEGSSLKHTHQIPNFLLIPELCGYSKYVVGTKEC